MLGSFFERLQPKKYFLLYAVFLLFISTADAVMSYTAPVVMERSLGSATWMGILLSTSSTAGMMMDFLFAKLFTNKRSTFYLRIVLSLVLLFPLTLLAVHAIPSFVFAMIVWGVYFEAWVFSNYHAVHEFVHPTEHAWAWGVLTTLRNLALVIGPFLASSLGGETMAPALKVALVLYAIGILLFISSKKLNPLRSPTALAQWGEGNSRGFFAELSIWRTYLTVLWPLVVFMFVFFLVDSSFYTVGPLLSEHLKQENPMGVWFVSLYAIPGLVVGFFVPALARPFGKKRASYLAGIGAGIMLLVMSQLHTVSLILLTTLIASIGLCIVYPQLFAVFEDYIARSGKTANDLIGLTAIASSISYIVGPIVNGLINDRFHEQAVFGMWGGALLLLSVGLLLFGKRKIRLPQQMVQEIIES